MAKTRLTDVQKRLLEQLIQLPKEGKKAFVVADDKCIEACLRHGLIEHPYGNENLGIDITKKGMNALYYGAYDD